MTEPAVVVLDGTSSTARGVRGFANASIAAARIQAAFRACQRRREHPRFAMIRSSLRDGDLEAARALGFAGVFTGRGFADSLAPSATAIQAHVRGRCSRKRLFALQESARLRWIEFHLSSRNVDAARALGWRLHGETSSDLTDGRAVEKACLIVGGAGSNLSGHRSGHSEGGAVPRSTALDFPRFVAAMHIAVYHAQSTSVPRDQMSSLVKWGYVWVPFFFILSGFVLTWSKALADDLGPMSARRRARAFGFCGGAEARPWLWKRLAGVYPLYVLSLLLGLWAVPHFAHPAGAWRTLLPMVLLLQAWAVELRCTEEVSLCAYTVWNEPAWFVSALAFCWLVFPLAYRHLAHDTRGVRTLCAGACLYTLSFWELVLWPNLRGVSAQTAEQIGTIIARSPPTNLNKFLLGAVLARLVLLHSGQRGDAGTEGGAAGGTARRVRFDRLPRVLRYAATPASATLACCFIWIDPDSIIGRESLVVPLYALIICSLAIGDDPLARLLSWPWLAWWGRLSYAIYILHNAVLAFASQLTMRPGYTLDVDARNAAFVPLVLLFSALAHYGVEKPAMAFYRRLPHCLAGGPASSAAAAARSSMPRVRSTTGAESRALQPRHLSV